MTEKNNRASARHSRHFAVVTPPCKAASATSSKHFLHSPSSAIGSVCSMPNFLSTLVAPSSNTMDEREVGQEEEECSYGRLAKAARAQFVHCPIFGEKQRAFRKANDSGRRANSGKEGGMSCCDERILELQCSVCHLCPHGCYLRAFAPQREWHYLRAAVSELASSEVLLRGWMCSLEGVSSASSSRKRKRVEKAPMVQTVFISPYGKCFKGRQRVLKELGLVGTTETDEPGVSLPKKLHHQELPLRNMSTQKHSDAALTAATNTSASLFEKSGVSPFGLLEELFRDDPWRLLLSTIMLNRTTRCQVDVVLYKFLQKWPYATSAANADETEMADVILPMGLRFRRAQGIIRFSREWLELLGRKATTLNKESSCAAFSLMKEEVIGLYNCGDYAYDAYRIFIQGNVNAVTTDHALQIYVDYHRGLEKAMNE